MSGSSIFGRRSEHEKDETRPVLSLRARLTTLVPAMSERPVFRARKADYGSGGAKSPESPVLQRRRGYAATVAPPGSEQIREDYSRLGESHRRVKNPTSVTGSTQEAAVL